MRQKKYKYFWKKGNDANKSIELVEWDENNQEYYNFIKEYIEKGYHQISITGEMMLGILENMSLNQSIMPEKIELMEDDGDVANHLQELVDKVRFNRGILVNIAQTLRFLEDESSIEIKRMTFTDQKNRGVAFIQVNGLLGTSNVSDGMVESITKYIKEYMNR